MAIKTTSQKEWDIYWARKERFLQATFLTFTTLMIAASTQSTITAFVMLALDYEKNEINKQTRVWDHGINVAIVGMAATVTVYAGLFTAKTVWKKFHN